MLRMGPRLELTVGTYIHIQNQDPGLFSGFQKIHGSHRSVLGMTGGLMLVTAVEQSTKESCGWPLPGPHITHISPILSAACFHATATATRVLFTRRGPGFSPWFYPISFCHEDVYFGFQNQLHQPTGHHQIYGFPQYIQDT